MVQEPTNFGVYNIGEIAVATSLNTGRFYRLTKIICTILTNTRVWTDMPAALTELLGEVNHRRIVDLTGCTQFRLSLIRSVSGSADPAVLGVQISNDGGTTFFGADNGTEDGQSTVTVQLNVSGTVDSAWTDIATGLRVDDAHIRIMGIDGDAAADPAIEMIEVQFR